MEFAKQIRERGGDELLRQTIDSMAQDSASQKAATLIHLPLVDRPKALTDKLFSMLEAFNTLHVSGEKTPDNEYTVDNPECGCLPPFMGKASEETGFTPQEARKYACRRCMPGYALAAKKVDIDFNGKLTRSGCIMKFMRKN
ncbi:MAG: hypothetical protein IIA87_01240 [Nanoarchaeota archaeon]|nr:hypothetical protein [Nanoarchaeota archaeon]